MENVDDHSKMLYKLETTVLHNMFKAYELRSEVVENRDVVLRNYAGDFNGHRQLATINTDKIFRNRMALLQTAVAIGQVEAHWKKSMIHEAKITRLEHQSEMNTTVCEISKLLAQANALVIEAGIKISEGTEKVNRDLISGSMAPSSSSTDTTAARVASNTARIAAIEKRVVANTRLLEELDDIIHANQSLIQEHSDNAQKNRDLIRDNHGIMTGNANKIATLLKAQLPTAGKIAGPGDTSQVDIAADFEKLHEVETQVLHNLFLAYEHRAMSEENRWGIQCNYDAAFRGNCQLANLDTDKIFRDRETILDALPALSPDEETWKNSMKHEAKVDFLQHRAELNAKVIEDNTRLADANRILIDVNVKIMEGNELVTIFNAKHITHHQRAAPRRRLDALAGHTTDQRQAYRLEQGMHRADHAARREQPQKVARQCTRHQAEPRGNC